MSGLTIEEVAQLCQTLTITDRASDAGRWPVATPWADMNTTALLALTKSEGADVWLDRRLRENRTAVPVTIATKLRERMKRAAVLNLRIDEQTVRVGALLTAHDLPWALIKGQARRAAASKYPFANARTVSDVDLLVPQDTAHDAWQLLCTHGFSRLYEESPWIKADHHLPVISDASGVAVELHTTTMLTVPPTEAWRRATEGSDEVEWQGLAVRVPSATELVWQALAGGAADGVEGFALRALLSVAAILTTQPSIDWELIAARMAAAEVAEVETDRRVGDEQLRRYLDLAAAFAGVEVPAVFRPRTPANIALLLRWRSRLYGSRVPRAVRERLLEEGLRVEASLPLTPWHALIDPFRNTRRRVSSIAARAIYTGWRASHGS